MRNQTLFCEKMGPGITELLHTKKKTPSLLNKVHLKKNLCLDIISTSEYFGDTFRMSYGELCYITPTLFMLCNLLNYTLNPFNNILLKFVELMCSATQIAGM